MVPSRLIPFGLQELGLRESKQKQKITQLVTNAKIQITSSFGLMVSLNANKMLYFC